MKPGDPLSDLPLRKGERISILLYEGKLDPVRCAAEGMGVLGLESRTFFNLDSEAAGQNLQIECLVFLGS